jgi:anti-sigma B factor antagonist
MTEDMTSNGLLAAVENDTAYIIVRERATYRMSPGFKRFCVTLMQSGVKHLILDMNGCPGMDSTFMGVVAGLSLSLHARKGDVLMVNLSAHLRGLLATLGLDNLVTARTSIPDDSRLAEMIAYCRPVPVDLSEPGKGSQAATMLDAHETLAALTPENEEKFRDVLKYLREDVEKQQHTENQDHRPGPQGSS